MIATALEVELTKKTNPDWPDPTDWARRLQHNLEEIGGEYFSLNWEVPADPDDFAGSNKKQAKAAEAILEVAKALRELPIFRDSKGVAILHDVAGSLRDVVMGGTPRMFTPTRAGKRGADGIHRNYQKVFVVWAVRFLIEAHGWKETKAVKLVAEKFAEAGATGRKGGPLSSTTVQDWCNKARPDSENPDEVRVDREVERNMEELRSHPIWPGVEAEAISWIERIARNPLIASKYG